MKALEKLDAMVKSGAHINIRQKEEGVATIKFAVSIYGNDSCSARGETLIIAISRAYHLAFNQAEQKLRYLRGGD